MVCTGGIAQPVPCAWTSSNNYLAAPFGRLLHIYDVTARPPKRQTTAEGHEGLITGVSALPGMQFVTSSLDCTLRFWDAMDGKCLRTIDVLHPILAMRPICRSIVYLTSSGVTIQSVESESRKAFLRHDFGPSSSFAMSSDCKIIAVTDGNYLIVAFPFEASLSHSTPTQSGLKLSYYEVSFYDMLTAVSVSSDGAQVAVADATGRIYHFRNTLLPSSGGPSRKYSMEKFNPTIWHWHSSSLHSLTFAHEDLVLLSVGREAVLVNWSLSPLSFGHKTFMARLGAPCIALSVSSNQLYYAISQFDNSISIIDQSTLSIVTIIRSIANRIQLRIDSSCRDEFKEDHVPACKGSGIGNILIANDNRCIQEFNAIRGEHVRNIDILPKNSFYFTSGGEEEEVGSSSNCLVTLVALHPIGKHLATVDVAFHSVLTNEGLHPRLEKHTTLRFWILNESNQWILNSVIKNPHGDGNTITTLVFHPVLYVLLTLGTDGTFKFWRAVSRTQRLSVMANVSWRGELTRNYREQVCSCAAFSFDGTILAIGSGNVLSLWEVAERAAGDTSTDGLVGLMSECTLEVTFRESLVYAPINEVLQNVKFVMCSVALFVTTTANGIYAWNAVTHELWWSIALDCDPMTLTVDPYTGRFAVSARVNSVLTKVKNKKEVEVNEESDVTDLVKLTKGNPGNEGDLKDTLSLVKDSMNHVVKTNDLPNGIKEGGTQHVHDNYNHSGRAHDMENSLPTRNEDEGPRDTAKPHYRSKRKRRKPKSIMTNVTNWENGMDSAVAVFDAASPVPIRVYRLSPGIHVSVLLFVDSKGSGPSCTDQSTLICIDSNLEINTIFVEDVTDDFSVVSEEFPSAIDTNRESDRDGNLDILLGDDWQGESRNITSKTTAQPWARNVSLEQAFENHFSGPIHTQVPISTHSFDFVKDLLKSLDGSGILSSRQGKGALIVNSAAADNNNSVEVEVPAKSQNDQQPENNDALSRLHRSTNVRSIREFCEQLVRTAK